MLEYTGHPLVDIGVATITAFAGKADPTLVTDGDLDEVADYVEREYSQKPLKSFLTVAFTSNAWFAQYAFDSQPEKRHDYADRLLRGYHADVPRLAESCVFTGEPATATSFSDSLPSGRAFRQHIPLLTGEGVINFYPWGDAGCPISGEASLCIQAFPLGCAPCAGRLLAVHSDNAELTLEYARRFLDENRRAIALAHQAKSDKMPGAGFTARTLLIDVLLDAEQRRRDAGECESRPSSITAYHLNNGKSVGLDLYHLPLQLTDFLILVAGPDYRSEWQEISRRGWWLTKPRKAKKGESGTETLAGKPHVQRNVLYEDLFELPAQAGRFVRTYFLRMPFRSNYEEDPRRGYSLQGEVGLISWKLAALFLRKVMIVDKERIEQIRELGDRLASYVSTENDRRFFTTFYTERRSYEVLRNALIRANLAWVKRGQPPFITLDPYIQVFEQGDEVAFPDWRLARDLVLIRMIEQLYGQGWLVSNRDAISESTNEDDATTPAS
ncbi:MAG TPA: type I-B CRISPR-associated protein Cas8b1/Cst1 [Anaerolineae bacterium]|nr:type I-B CRISPR-associated protein Cas8b1/Cst1 [Anaerolineae bacterium]HOR00088.1 type I-B CRISPR-associated protein Cas8b1/Cst1 [Anaerolineae bacterium]HPL26884.1 type I-B CRISPR-associated protein Cas8b1/Cst1 [Anaerolineae bacterium]